MNRMFTIRAAYLAGSVLALTTGCKEKSTREAQSEAYDRAWVSIHAQAPRTRNELEKAIGVPPSRCAPDSCVWSFLAKDDPKEISAALAGETVIFIHFDGERMENDIYPALMDAGRR